MSFKELNASYYQGSEAFYNAEFEEILSKIISCYNLMISDNVVLNNDENKIRDILYLNYLNNNDIRNKIELKNFYFDREIAEDRSNGRTDIRILSSNSFEDTSAYYIIECKRLDLTNPTGTTGLNAKYVQNGISRFVSQVYSTYYKTNGMIGFVIQPMDIHKNTDAINGLLRNTLKTTRELYTRQILSGFDFSYCSTHSLNNLEITIYHLMFDFSNNIR